MDGEKRKDHRQSLQYPATIDVGDGTPPRQCLLSNISDSGARVSVDSPDDIPDRFVLLLAAEHGTQRRCQVIWRDANQLGLQFIKPPVTKDRPPRRNFFKGSAHDV